MCNICVCTQQPAHSVRFQAPHLLNMPLFHRYDYWYLRYMSANYLTFALMLVIYCLHFNTALFLKLCVNLRRKREF